MQSLRDGSATTDGVTAVVVVLAGAFFGEVRGAGLPADAVAEGGGRRVKTTTGASDSLDEARVG